MRIFVLMSFFHFCGLNNGFSYFVVTAGGAAGSGLAAVSLQQSFSLLAPAGLRMTVLGRLAGLVGPESGVVRAASRIASFGRLSAEGISLQAKSLPLRLSRAFSRPTNERESVHEYSPALPAVLSADAIRKTAPVTLPEASGWRLFFGAAHYLILCARESWLGFLRLHFKRAPQRDGFSFSVLNAAVLRQAQADVVRFLSGLFPPETRIFTVRRLLMTDAGGEEGDPSPRRSNESFNKKITHPSWRVIFL